MFNLQTGRIVTNVVFYLQTATIVTDVVFNLQTPRIVTDVQNPQFCYVGHHSEVTREVFVNKPTSMANVHILKISNPQVHWMMREWLWPTQGTNTLMCCIPNEAQKVVRFGLRSLIFHINEDFDFAWPGPPGRTSRKRFTENNFCSHNILQFSLSRR